MGRGTYPLVRADLKSCGCKLKIDVFLATNPKHVGASSVIAAAIHFGDTTVVMRDASLTITGSLDGDTVLTMGTPGAHPFSGVEATAETREMKGKVARGWKVSLPGGGYLKAFRYEVSDHSIFSVWVNLPNQVTVTGLCGQTCSGFPFLPNTQCDLKNDCLPVRAADTVFPAATLRDLESKFSMPLSTRDCGPVAANEALLPLTPPPPSPSPSPPPSPPPPPASCSVTVWTGSSTCTGSRTKKANYNVQSQAMCGPAPILEQRLTALWF